MAGVVGEVDATTGTTKGRCTVAAVVTGIAVLLIRLKVGALPSAAVGRFTAALSPTGAAVVRVVALQIGAGTFTVGVWTACW